MIEHNRITGDPLIVAPERARRPNMFRKEEACPFCPGNESMTPPELMRIGDPWRVRVFPNKYPATEAHEIIVESPGHDDDFSSIAYPDEPVNAYFERYQDLAQHNRHVTLFKNHGPMAGASISHLHSQLLGTPFTPPRIEHEAAAFGSRCALCSLADELIIRETDTYRWFAPRGCMFAFEQWIVPKRHTPEMTEPRELAVLLQASARTMRQISDSYNWIFINFPDESRAHWYVQLFPRLSPHAGFELASGSAISVVDAEETLRRFRV